MQSIKRISIKASPEELWRVLTEAAFTKKYMFNCEVDSDWKVGSTITWQGNYEGYEAFQKGEIIEYEKPKRLTYSTFDPNFGLEDKAENYIHVSYELIPGEHSTDLIVSNKTFDGNEERMKHIEQGWEMVMSKIKEVAEE